MDINTQFSYSPVVGINRNNLSVAFSCAPNPVRSTLYLKNRSGQCCRHNLSYKSLRGNLWQQTVVFQSESAIPVNVENQPPGIYFIKVQTKDQAQQFKIIKQ